MKVKEYRVLTIYFVCGKIIFMADGINPYDMSSYHFILLDFYKVSELIPPTCNQENNVPTYKFPTISLQRERSK